MKNFTIKRRYYLLIAVGFVAASCLPAKNTASTTGIVPAPDSLSSISQKIEGLVAEGSLPSMAVAVVRDGIILWQAAYGYADSEREELATRGSDCC